MHDHRDRMHIERLVRRRLAGVLVAGTPDAVRPTAGHLCRAHVGGVILAAVLLVLPAVGHQWARHLRPSPSEAPGPPIACE